MYFACSALLPALRSGACVVTPSHLLAQVASHNYAESCLAEGLESWPRPEVYSTGAWLQTCWQEARFAGSDVPSLLSGVQEHALWQRIIQAQTPNLFDIESTATLAGRALAQMAEWQVPLENDAWREHEDGRQFREWLTIFRKTCKEEGWISRSDLWRLVPQWMASGWCRGGPIAFAGFVSDTPTLSLVRKTLGSAAKCLRIEQNSHESIVPARRCADMAAEIETAARWARAAFEQDPKTSIGVFVPDLAANRALVQRTFNQICYPAEFKEFGARGPTLESESVFHLHARSPLRDHPLIEGALLLLQLGSARIPIGEAGAILRSPWIDSATEERNQRAQADFALRRTRELDVSLRDLEFRATACPKLQVILQRVRQIISERPVRAEFSVWSEFFSDILGALGWPGDVELTSVEQEIVEMWKEGLSKLASLTLVSPSASYDAAVSSLKLLLDERGFTGGDFFSPIQVLDASQASGLRFNQVFVAGLSEENSLVRPLISPLIPPKLQRACGIPGSSANSVHQSRQGALRDLFGTAPRLYASYTNRILPAAEKFVSPDSGDWPLWNGRTARQSLVAAELDRFADTNAPPYRPGARSLGGTGLIKDQSQCPFRAFAVRRLNARSLEDGSFGLDSLERGRFVHDALKMVWDDLKTLEGLKKIPPFELQFLVQDAVKRAVHTREDGPLHQQLSLAEIDRLIEVVLAWLEIERNRKQPFQVETTEQARVLEVAGLQLNIRIDRIDRLRNGKHLLIDYKSGDTSAASLNKERPREPQLLAYAAAMRDEVDGFFFAQLKPRNAALVGYARELHIDGQKPPGKNVKWDDYLRDRIGAVERLAESFVAGDAAVDPLTGACQYCGVTPFCRVNELRYGRSEDRDD